MGERPLKPGWKIWRFDQMAINVNDRIDNPAEADVEHYVGLEHLDSDSLKIRRWGAPSEVEATKLRFRKGDIIFGRRRAYQRKLAVAEFDGICSAHAMVLRPKTEVVLPEFLPFFMQSDLFMNRALEISVGSLSPTINWKTLASQEFALPPIEEQQRVFNLLKAEDSLHNAFSNALESLHTLKQSKLLNEFGSYMPPQENWCRISDYCKHIGDGTHFPPPFMESGVPFLLVSNISSGKLDANIARWITKDDYQELIKSFRPSIGDILFSLVGSYGVPVYVNWDWDFSFQRHIGIIRSDQNRLRGKYLFYFLQSQPALRQANQCAEGLAQKTITLRSLRSYRLPIPDISEQDRIIEEIQSIDDSLSNIEKRISSLVEMRKATLLMFLEGHRVL